MKCYIYEIYILKDSLIKSPLIISNRNINEIIKIIINRYMIIISTNREGEDGHICALNPPYLMKI